MRHVRVEWLTMAQGGRKIIPPGGRYFAVSRFPEDTLWQNGAWSVVFNFHPPVVDGEKNVSYGEVKFLVENAPHERMENHEKFDVYEGPRKVAVAFLKWKKL